MGAEFWVAVSFILFVLVVLYFKVPALVTKALDDRAQQIKSELEEARKLKEEAQSILADYKRKLQEAEQEAEEIVAHAHEEAEAFAAETRDAQKASLERRRQMAEDKIARAEEQAQNEVRTAAVETAVAAADRLIREKMSGDASDRFIAESIESLKGKLH